MGRIRTAFTPVFDYPEAKVVWGLRATLAALALYGTFVDPKFTTRPLLVTTALWGLAASLPFAFLRTDRPRTLSAAEAGVLLGVVAHVSGHAFGFYDAAPWYDNALHFVMPLIMVFVLWALSQATTWIWDWRRVTPVAVAVHLFALSVTLASVWEALEFGMDTFAGTKEQDNNADTMLDLVLGLTASALGALGVAVLTKIGRERGFDAVSEEPKRHPDRPAKGRSA